MSLNKGPRELAEMMGQPVGRRQSDPDFGESAATQREGDGRRTASSSARPSGRRVLPQPPSKSNGSAHGNGSGGADAEGVQQQPHANATRTRGAWDVPRSNSDGTHQQSGGGSSRPTSGWERKGNSHQEALAEAMAEVANGSSSATQSNGARPMSRIGTASRRIRGHRRQRSLPSYELQGLNDAMVTETSHLTDFGHRAANISPLAHSWAPGEGAAALAAFAGLTTNGSSNSGGGASNGGNGSYDGTQSLRMPSAATKSKSRGFRHSRSVDDSLDLSKMSSARRTKKRFDLRKSMSEINPTDVRAARNQMLSTSGFGMLKNGHAGSDTNLAERGLGGSARGSRGGGGKHGLMLGGSAMGISVPMPATPFGNSVHKSALGKSISPDAVALLPRIHMGKTSPTNTPAFLPPLQLPTKQSLSPETTAAPVRPEPRRRAVSSGRASPEELMAAADAIAAEVPPHTDEPIYDDEDGDGDADGDADAATYDDNDVFSDASAFNDAAEAAAVLREESPPPSSIAAAPLQRPAHSRSRKRRGSLSESALRYLDYLSTVCVVPFDKLDQYRVALGLGGPNDSLVSQLALKELLRAVVDGKEWSDMLLNYAMAVLDFTADVDAIERDFRLYAVALLVESVFDLPEETKALVETMDLADPTVTQIFGLAKRAFLVLDARRTGYVNVDALFEALHADSSGAVGPDGNAMTKLACFVNDANEINLLDLLSNLVHFVDGRDLFGALQPSASFFKKMDGSRKLNGGRSRPSTAGRVEPR